MKSSNLFWGTILILAGGLFLLDSLGIIAVNVWDLLWPLFLIALGVWFLWGTLFRKEPAVEHARVPLENARRARIILQHGAGRLDVHAGAEMGNLLEGDFGGGLNLNSQRNGDLLDVRLSIPAQVFPFGIGWGPGYTLNWSLGLTRDIPLSLDIEGGANESRLDLSELRVTDLRIRSGASSTTVTLPANAGQTRASIESGAASVRLTVPPGVAARIRSRSGLSSITVDQARFPRQGDIYQSPDYEAAANRVDIDLQSGVGSIDVR